ncbi:MAG: hypothetical protein WBM29_05830 [Candidatus Deferrimicrobium sp.]
MWALDDGNPPKWRISSDAIPTPEQARKEELAEIDRFDAAAKAEEKARARKATLTPEQARQERKAEWDRIVEEEKERNEKARRGEPLRLYLQWERIAKEAAGTIATLALPKVGREAFRIVVEPESFGSCAPDVYRYRAWEFGEGWLVVARIGVHDDDYADMFKEGPWHRGEMCKWSEAGLRRVARELSRAGVDPLELVHVVYMGRECPT